jgi:hypothetical protein
MTPPSRAARAAHVLAPLAVAALLLGGCGTPASGPGGPGSAPATVPATVAPPVTSIPPASGPVTGTGTVIQTPGGDPQLCLGPVMESYPPQCDGIPLVGWDWETTGPHEQSDLGGEVTRWGTWAVTGTFDGTTMTVTGSVPLALYDVAAQPSPRPVAPPDLTDAGWARVEAGVRLLPGLLTSAREGDTGPVLADVVHDDGTLQDWADASFGPGAVRVTSALR